MSNNANPEQLNHLDDDTIGDNHLWNSIETPMRADAFELTDEQKIERIAASFKDIMHTLGLDLNDDSLKGTPKRVAKMYVKELFSGLNPAAAPSATTFENKYQYGQMLVEKNIKINSNCEHHFLPILGKAHVAYISSGRVIGLSKINRIVDYYSRRPQVQERLTLQILHAIKKALKTEDVAVVVDTKHFCVVTRGVKDQNSSTVTVEFSGQFNDPEVRKAFFTYISLEQPA